MVRVSTIYIHTVITEFSLDRKPAGIKIGLIIAPENGCSTAITGSVNMKTACYKKIFTVMTLVENLLESEV